MTVIKLKVVDENIEFVSTPPVYSGDVNTISTLFEFGEAWDGFVKTAVFYREITKPYQAVLQEDVCYIPHEVMEDKGRIYMGVFGVKENKVKTSEVVYYDIGTGVITGIGIAEPSPDVWVQILAELQRLRELSQEFVTDREEFIREQNADREAYQAKWEKEVDGSIKEAQQATVQCYDAISSLQLEIFDMNGGDPFTTPSEGDLDANGGYPQ